MIRTSIVAGVPKYDIVSFTGSFVPSFAADGLLLPIDYSLWGDVARSDVGPAAASDFAVPSYVYSIVLD